jgi:type II secretory pathway pseudopilin PulG
VVVAIIGILSIFVIAGLAGARKSGRDAKRISDIKNIQLALTLYYHDTGHYPCSVYQDITNPTHCAPGFSTYMSTVPRDPSNSYYFYSIYNNGESPNCNSTNPPVMYHLGAALEIDTSSAILYDDEDWNPTGNACDQGENSSFNTGFEFFGSSFGCSLSGNTPDTCYDFTSN